MDLTPTVNFFNSPFFTIYGGITATLTIALGVYAAYLVIKGVIPVWYRLGMGLAKSTIAIYSLNEFDSLKNMLTDSKIFKENNIIQITKTDLARAEKAKVFLVHWNDFKENLDEILAMKKGHIALIVYAPQSEGKIELDEINKINLHRNAVIVNMRGRLMNDILTSLITANYGR